MEESTLTPTPLASLEIDPGSVVRVERVIAADLATIWKALLDADDTSVWFARMQCEPRAGSPLSIAWEDGDGAFGEVLVCESESCFSYSWSWHGIGNTSVVTWRLAPAPAGGVTVTLTHELPDAFDHAEYQNGWTYFTSRLADLCEGAAVPQRRLSEPPGAVEMAIDLPASPARVWGMLTDESDVGRWFARCHLEPWLGGAVAFFGYRTGRLLDQGEITTWEPEQRLAYTWAEPGWPADTVVEWTLTRIPGGTRLSVSHGGWSELPLALSRGDRPGKTAWRDALADLRALLTDDGKIPSDGFRHMHVVHGSVAEAWKILTSTAIVRRWIGMPDEDAATVAYEATLGGEVRIENANGDSLIGRVTAFEPGRLIVWMVRPGGIGPECIYTFEVTAELPGHLFGARVSCTARGFELEHDRDAAERRVGVWLHQIQKLAQGEEPTRIERRAPDAITLTLDLAAPTTRVFAALTRDEELPNWLCESAEFGSGMGGTFELRSRAPQDRVVFDRGRVTEFRPGERLGLAWTRVGAGWGAPIVMTFDLRPLKGGTRLRFHAEGWEALPLSLRDAERAAAAIRWRKSLGLLRDAVLEESVKFEHAVAVRSARAEEREAASLPVARGPGAPQRVRSPASADVRYGAPVPSRVPYKIEEDENDPDSVKPRRSSVGHARPPRDRDRPRDADGVRGERPRPVKRSGPPKREKPAIERGTRGILRDPTRLWKEKPMDAPEFEERGPRGGGAARGGAARGGATRGGATARAGSGAPARAGSAARSGGGGAARGGSGAARPGVPAMRTGAASRGGAAARLGGAAARGGSTTRSGGAAPRSAGPRGAAPARSNSSVPRGASAMRSGSAALRGAAPARSDGTGPRFGSPSRSAGATARGSAPTRPDASAFRGAPPTRSGSASASRGGPRPTTSPGRPSARPTSGKQSAPRGGPRPATPRNSRAGATIGGRKSKPPRGGR